MTKTVSAGSSRHLPIRLENNHGDSCLTIALPTEQKKLLSYAHVDRLVDAISPSKPSRAQERRERISLCWVDAIRSHSCCLKQKYARTVSRHSKVPGQVSLHTLILILLFSFLCIHSPPSIPRLLPLLSLSLLTPSSPSQWLQNSSRKKLFPGTTLSPEGTTHTLAIYLPTSPPNVLTLLSCTVSL